MERGCKNRTLFTLEMVFIQYQNLEPHSPYCVTVTFKWSPDEIFDNEFYLTVKMPLLQRVLISSKVTHIIYYIYAIKKTKQCTLQVIITMAFLIGIHFMQGWTVTGTMRHGVTRKRSTKRVKHTGNLFRKNLLLKGVS